MSLPYTFIPFTTIYSAQVNANNQYLAITLAGNRA